MALSLSFGCGNAKEPAPRTPARGAVTQRVATAKSAASSAAALERAVDFERRGVLDRAAGARRALFETSGDPAQLLLAAELYERALALPFAAECYAELARFSEFAARADAGTRRIAAIGAETFYDHEARPAAQAALARAREHVQHGELAAARDLLATEDGLRANRSALSLLGSIHWREGDRVAAQRAWAQGRSVSRIPLAAATVWALPTFHYAPTDFSFRGDSLWFASAGGSLFTYDPELRSFEWLDTRTGPLERLSSYRDVPELWSFQGVRSEAPELSRKVTAVASRDGQRAVWLTNDRVAYFAPNDGDRLEPRWAYDVPRATASTAKKRLGVTTFLSATFSPGTSETELVFVGTSDGTVRALSATGKELFAFAAHDGGVTELATSSDGALLATAGADKKAHVWELDSPRRRVTLPVEGEARSLAFFPDDATLELAHSWELVRYDARTGNELSRTRRGVEFLRVEHSASKRWTAVGHYKTTSLDLYEGTAAEPFAVTTSQVLDVYAALARDHSAIALAASTGVLAAELEPFRVVRLSDTFATGVAISPSGRFIAAIHENEVRVYPRAGGAPVSTITFGRSRPRSLEFRSDAELALLGHAENRAFKVTNGQPLAQEDPKLRRHPLAEGELVWSDAGLERRTRAGRSAETIDRVAPAVGVNRAGTHFAYQRNSDLVVRTADGSKHVSTLMGFTPEHLALSDSAERVAAVVYPSRVMVFDLSDGSFHELPAETHAGLGGVNGLAFYGDEWLLVSGTDGLLAFDWRNPSQRAGLHLLASGGWFTVVNRTYSTLVDGDERAIDACGVYPHGSPGLYWEGFRADGSFAALLRGKLPPDE